MASTIKKRAPMVWLLVKVPQITDVGSGSNQTVSQLRDDIRYHHFGGEKAAVRRLTRKEIAAIQFVSDSRPLKAAQPVERDEK